MKKRLRLNRETLRELTGREMSGAAGGGATTALCLGPTTRTLVGNTCGGASCFPTCAQP